AALHAIAAQLGVPGLMRATGTAHAKWLAGLCEQLQAARGACVIAAGHSLSHRAHVLAWRINAHLDNIGNTVVPLAQEMPPGIPAASQAPDGVPPRTYPAALGELVAAMRDREVGTLVIVN